MKKVIIICILMCLGLASYAQDVITLRSGDEIKGKVTEISPTEIRYKRADNPDGPTVVIAKKDVFAINYANGTREVINAGAAAPAAPAASAYTAAPATVVATSPQRVSAGGAPHEKNFYTGVYLNALGFALAGPMVGCELTFGRHWIVDGALRFPAAGALSGYLSELDAGVTNMGGIGVGIAGKYFTGGRNGGFYVGPALEFYATTYNYDGGYWDGTGTMLGANLGYKFQFQSGFYMRAGSYIGVVVYSGTYDGRYEEGTGAGWLGEFSLGWAF
jgi:hypothetical protein